MSVPTEDLRLIANVRRLRDLLQALGHPRWADVNRVLDLYTRDRDTFFRAVNSNRWWSGAGSLAAETMADNPGVPEDIWLQEIRNLREVFIDIGEELMERGDENPGISSWVLAFRNWNASGV